MYGRFVTVGIERLLLRTLSRAILLLGLAMPLAVLADAAQPPTIPMRSEPARFGWHLDTEAMSTVDGGLRRGTAADTVLQVAGRLDTGALGLWSGGRVYLAAVHIVSGEPSSRYIGDLQGASNLAAHSTSRVYQFWYRQRLGATASVRVGLIDLNQYLAVTDNAGLLINSSFGILPTISGNVPSSIYPEPGVGAVVELGSADATTRIGLFQGQPEHRGEPFDGGAMVIGQHSRGGVTLGAWQYRGHGTTVPANDWGAYAIVDRNLFQSGGRRIAGFLQAGASPGHVNTVPYYLGVGLQIPGLVPGRPGDRMAAGVARAWIRHSAVGAETTWELTYAAQIGRHTYLQPDLQYIVHPAGAVDPASATVATLRLHIEFE